MTPGSIHTVTRPLVVLGLLLLPHVSALEAQESDPAEVRAAIEAGNAEYIAAYASQKAEALAAVYAPDGARLGNGGSVLRGRDAIAASVGRFMDQAGPVAVHLETVEVWVVSDRAYETGIWSYTYTPKSGTERTVGGRYVTIWRRQVDGGWRIEADIGVPGTTVP